ncbi:hypothetical protein [Frigidibacter sp. MR17.24]|uniref:hypothetical protein n=1 Tax=Frigidibacter sp. MR17.24 TaxID=3127345 RepID=UPI003012F8BD
MTYAYSKSAKRKAKKAKVEDDPFALAPVPRREKDGHIHRERAERDPSIKALQVRCRKMGKEISAGAIRDMRAPWNGCKAGRAMAIMVTSADERLELWDAIQHMRRVQLSYDRAIGAPSRHAVCMRLLLPIDALEADAETPPQDERSDEEKDREAVSAWMRVRGWLGYTDTASMNCAIQTVIDDETVLDLAAARGLISALRCVSDGLTGRRMIYRGVA